MEPSAAGFINFTFLTLTTVVGKIIVYLLLAIDRFPVRSG